MTSLSVLISGVLLGLAAGITPGPLTTLVISESLKQGKKAGAAVALAPAITDGPIILLSILFTNYIVKIDLLFGLISICGGVVVFLMGYNDLIKKFEINLSEAEYKSPIKKAVLTNVLTPYPYLFWFTIGAPMIVNTGSENTLSPVMFIVGFYFCLVGSKMLIAFSVDKLKILIADGILEKILKILGIVLIIFSIVLIVDGIKFIVK